MAFHPIYVLRSPVWVSVICLFLSLQALSQNRGPIKDGRFVSSCVATQRLLEDMPEEVLFGISIDTVTADVYFSMSDRIWFNKLFLGPNDGVTADLVTKSQYDCNAVTPPNEKLPKGFMLPVVYLDELKQKMKDNALGSVIVKIGQVPASLRKNMRDLEGNLVVVKNGLICHYTNFVDIDRSLWALLPMGLHTDTVISTEKLLEPGSSGVLQYTRKLQFTIPFAKNKTVFNQADLKPLYDSLHLVDYRIRKIAIRAYSSIEGTETANKQLQKQRSLSMIKALQQYQTKGILQEVTTAENWIEFYQDVARTPHASLSGLSREAVKQKLQDKVIADQLEPVLKNHRKAIVTIYLDNKRGLEKVANQDLSVQFRNALAQKNIYKASLIQQEVYERIADNRLPRDYEQKLEVPQEKGYSMLLSDRETYKYQLGLTGEDEALENFKTLFLLDSTSGRIRYNICALTFPFWQYDTAFIDRQVFLHDIESLRRFGIESSLVKRMLINYHIISCEHSMYRNDYASKDISLLEVVRNYMDIQLSDPEILSLAKYLCLYSKCPMAEKLVAKRVTSIDVNEDLLFYYINIKLFEPGSLLKLKTEVNNAININRSRFCRLFNSLNNGGASFQLLGDPSLKKVYCEYCQVK